MNLELLYAYLDGELAPEETARIEDAVARDPALAMQLETLRGVDRALGSLPGQDASVGFGEGVAGALRRRRRRGLVVRLAAPLAAAAALALAIVVPRGESAPVIEDLFTTQEHLAYVWEDDVETFGSLDLNELQDQILEGLEST